MWLSANSANTQYLFLSLISSHTPFCKNVSTTFWYFLVAGLSSAFLIKYIFIFSYIVMYYLYIPMMVIFQPKCQLFKGRVPVFGISSIITHSDD